jgi:hypothetical protein
MSQTGFPNGGILPDDTETHTYSNLILTEGEIQSIGDEIRKYVFEPGVVDPTVQITLSNQAEGIVTAVLGLAQYYHQQISYQGVDGYGSVNNPVSPVMSESTNTIFAQSLGSDPDPQSLYNSYQNRATGPRELVGVQNFFFNLGLGPEAFSWDANGNLNINDTYVFTGLNDFGVSPPESLKARASSGDVGAILQTIPYVIGGMVGVVLGGVIFGGQAVIRSTADGIIGIIANVFFNGLRPNADPTQGFDWSLWRDENGNPYTDNQLGSIEPMAIRKRFTPQELYDSNPELFWNAVKRGLIPFEALLNMPDFICNSIEVGTGPTFFLPNYGSVSGNVGSNWTYGGGGNYPRPFTSFSQRIVEATYSLGPFAKFGPISGRVVVLGTVCNVGSNYSAQVGFIRQDWSGADIGNSQYTANNELFKNDWWNQAVKTKHNLRYGHLPGHPILPIEVATASYTTGAPEKYDPDLPAPEDYTLLLGTVLAVAALGAII